MWYEHSSFANIDHTGRTGVNQLNAFVICSNLLYHTISALFRTVMLGTYSFEITLHIPNILTP